MDLALADSIALPGLLAAFTMGLLGSGHCAGMCGGIACALSARLPGEVRASALRLAPRLLAYNAGRVGSYAMIGALAGAFGGALAQTLPVRAVPVVGFALSGLLLVAVGAHVAGWWRGLAVVERLGASPWRGVERVVARVAPREGTARALAYGALWGAMPCGLVYGALLLALTAGSATAGALRMLAFGLGTAPMVLVLGVAGGWLVSLARDPSLRRWAGASLIALGVLTVLGSGLFTRMHTPGLAGIEGLCTADGIGAALE